MIVSRMTFSEVIRVAMEAASATGIAMASAMGSASAHQACTHTSAPLRRLCPCNTCTHTTPVWPTSGPHTVCCVLCAVGLNIHILKLGCTRTAVSQLLHSYLQHHALVSVTCCLCVTISTVIEVFFGSGAGPPTQHNLLPLWPDHLLGGDQVLLDCNHRRQCSEHGIDDESQTSCLPNTSPYGAMPFNLANRGLQNMTWYPTPGTSSRLCKSACCADASSDMRPGLC